MLSLLLTLVVGAVSVAALVQGPVADNELTMTLAAFSTGLALSILAAGAQIVGGLRMRQLESRWLALGAAIAAMVPLTPAWIVGLPAGIWCLFVLNRRAVEEAFREQSARWEGLEHSLIFASRLLRGTAILHFAFIPFAWVHHIFVPDRGAPWLTQTIALGIATALVVLAGAIIYSGGRRMGRGESWNWSLAASVAALFPLTPAVLLGLPAGLYALSLLTKPSAFHWFATPGKPVEEIETPASL
jgi:hypothetical protein